MRDDGDESNEASTTEPLGTTNADPSDIAADEGSDDANGDNEVDRDESDEDFGGEADEASTTGNHGRRPIRDASRRRQN